MKKIIWTAAAVLVMAACSTPQNSGTITIRGKVAFPAEEGNIEVLEQQGFDRVTHASVPVNPDGTYELSFKVERPGSYSLNCQNHQRVNFWAEDENLEIDFRGRDTAKMRMSGPTYVHIKGGPSNDFMNIVNWIQTRSYWAAWEMYKVPYDNDKVKGDEFKQELGMANYTAMSDDMRTRIEHAVRYYGDVNSVVSVLPSVRRNKELYDMAVARLEKRMPGYEPWQRHLREVAEKEAKIERVKPGNTAPAFSYETPDGTQKLGPESFRGKYLVIDFWASWCGPCRAEIPELKQTYEQYKNKGVEMLSVSIDKDDAAWRKAMEQEAMPWPQVKAPDVGKEVMDLYQFSGIPHIVLLDKEGKIVGKDYRGQALRDKLAELIK